MSPRPQFAMLAPLMPTRRCPRCSDVFYTQVGLDEHMRLGRHRRQAYARRWINGFSPEGLVAQQERGRQIAAQNNARHRRCEGCGRVSTLAGLALHQKHSGHTGWSEVEAA